MHHDKELLLWPLPLGLLESDHRPVVSDPPSSPPRTLSPMSLSVPVVADDASVQQASEERLDEGEEPALGSFPAVNGDEIYCVCRGCDDGRPMVCCDVCDNWFHAECVNVSQQMIDDIELNEAPWSCPSCLAKVEQPVHHLPPTPDYQILSAPQTPLVDIKRRRSKRRFAQLLEMEKAIGFDDEEDASYVEQQVSQPKRTTRKCIMCSKAAVPSSRYCGEYCEGQDKAVKVKKLLSKAAASMTQQSTSHSHSSNSHYVPALDPAQESQFRSKIVSVLHGTLDTIVKEYSENEQTRAMLPKAVNYAHTMAEALEEACFNKHRHGSSHILGTRDESSYKSLARSLNLSLRNSKLQLLRRKLILTQEWTPEKVISVDPNEFSDDRIKEIECIRAEELKNVFIKNTDDVLVTKKTHKGDVEVVPAHDEDWRKDKRPTQLSTSSSTSTLLASPSSSYSPATGGSMQSSSASLFAPLPAQHQTDSVTIYPLASSHSNNAMTNRSTNFDNNNSGVNSSGLDDGLNHLLGSTPSTPIRTNGEPSTPSALSEIFTFPAPHGRLHRRQSSGLDSNNDANNDGNNNNENNGHSGSLFLPEDNVLGSPYPVDNNAFAELLEAVETAADLPITTSTNSTNNSSVAEFDFVGQSTTTYPSSGNVPTTLTHHNTGLSSTKLSTIPVWTGSLHLTSSVAIPAHLNKAGGRELTESESWASILPPAMYITGRLDARRADEYVLSLKASTSRDVFFFTFDVPSDSVDSNITSAQLRTEYANLFQSYHSSSRYAVVASNAKGKKGKEDTFLELYLMPFQPKDEFPEFMEEYTHGLSTIRDVNLFLGVLVARKPEHVKKFEAEEENKRREEQRLARKAEQLRREQEENADEFYDPATYNRWGDDDQDKDEETNESVDKQDSKEITNIATTTQSPDNAASTTFSSFPAFPGFPAGAFPLLPMPLATSSIPSFSGLGNLPPIDLNFLAMMQGLAGTLPPLQQLQPQLHTTPSVAPAFSNSQGDGFVSGQANNSNHSPSPWVPDRNRSRSRSRGQYSDPDREWSKEGDRDMNRERPRNNNGNSNRGNNFRGGGNRGNWRGQKQGGFNNRDTSNRTLGQF